MSKILWLRLYAMIALLGGTFSALSAQWTNLGHQTIPLQMTSDYHGIRVNQVAGPTPATGSHWTVYSTNDDFVSLGQGAAGGGGLGCCYVEGIDFLNDSVGFMLQSNQGLRSVQRTTDRGVTWQPMAQGAASAITEVAQIYALDDTSAFLIGHGVATRSTLALRWSTSAYTPVFESTTLEGNDGRINFVTSSLGFVVVHDSNAVYRLLRTTDGGANWSQRLAVGVGPLRAIDFLDAQTGFVTGESGVFYKTTDAGVIWNSLAINGPVNAYALDMATDSIGFIGATGGQVLRTIDGGANWSLDVIDSNITLVSVKAISTTIAYALSSDSVLYKRDYVAGENAAAQVSHAVHVFPNPAKDVMHIGVDGTTRLHGWTLYDLQGRALQAGTSVTVDVSSLPSGIYLLSLHTDHGIHRQKVVRD